MGFRKNYHGGRIYEEDPTDGPGNAARLVTKLKKLINPRSQPSTDEQRPPFTLLGAEEQFSRHLGAPVLPMEEWLARRNISLKDRRPPSSPGTAATKPAPLDH